MSKKWMTAISKNFGFKVISFICLFWQIPQHAIANDEFDRLNESVSTVVAAGALMNLVDYNFNSGNCLFGYSLDQGAEQSLTSYFYSNTDYVIIAAGESKVQDLDLKITDQDGMTTLFNDSDNSSVAVLTFRFSSSGRRKIVIKNYRSTGNSFCSFIVLAKTGTNNVNLTLVSESLTNSLIFGTLTSALVDNYRFPHNKMVAFGGIYGQGAWDGIYNIGLATGTYAFLSAGSDNVSDMDAKVIKQYASDNQNGTVVAIDEKSDRFGLCAFSAYSSESYYLQSKNNTSNGNGFALNLLLKNN